MSLVWAVLIVAATTALAVTVMLLVRRGAPEGSRFRDGDRASRRVRRARDGLLGAARLHLPRVRELRPVTVGRRGRGARGRPAGRDRTASGRARAGSPRRSADLLRPLDGEHRVAPRHGGNVG